MTLHVPRVVNDSMFLRYQVCRTCPLSFKIQATTTRMMMMIQITKMLWLWKLRSLHKRRYMPSRLERCQAPLSMYNK